MNYYDLGERKMNNNFKSVRILRIFLIGFLCTISAFYTDIRPFAEEKEPKTGVLEDGEEIVDVEENTIYISAAEVKNEENGWIAETVDGKELFKYRKNDSEEFAIGKVRIGLNNYFFDENGYLVVDNWCIENNKKTYYAGFSGILVTGKRTIDGRNYLFSDDCRLSEEKVDSLDYDGWVTKTSDGKEIRKYKDKSSGKFVKGKKKIGKDYFYFDKNANLITKQWIFENEKKTYYADSDGKLVKGFKEIGGYELYFDDNYKFSQDLIKSLGNEWYNKQKIKIRVNKYKNHGTIYAMGKSGKYNMPVKSFGCTSGFDTPSLTVNLKKENTYRWRELMGPCYGQFSTRIYKGFLFHSVLYRRPDKYSLNPFAYNKLGVTASHGCIRLAVIDAKRIYDDVRYRGRIELNIYGDSKEKLPFDKPQYKKVGANQRFDPTDPTVRENQIK